MKKIYILLLVLLGACASNNLAYLDDKQTLNGNTELLKVNSDICNQFKSTDKEFYSCGSGFSSDLELAKSKAILNASSFCNRLFKYINSSDDNSLEAYNSDHSQIFFSMLFYL